MGIVLEDVTDLGEKYGVLRFPFEDDLALDKVRRKLLGNYDRFPTQIFCEECGRESKIYIPPGRFPLKEELDVLKKAHWQVGSAGIICNRCKSKQRDAIAKYYGPEAAKELYGSLYL